MVRKSKPLTLGPRGTTGANPLDALGFRGRGVNDRSDGRDPVRWEAEVYRSVFEGTSSAG